MKLKYQLFLTLLAASALLITLMYVISSWSFSRGFLGYVSQNEAERLQLVADRLVDRFEEEGGWQWVEGKSLQSIQGFSKRRGGPRQGRPSRETDDRQNSRRRPPPGPIVLTDADKQPIFGKLKSDKPMHWLPLESEGTVQGYLVSPKISRISNQFDQLFEQEQKKSFGITALAMILLSGLLSIPLASRIVKPLLTVNSAVSEISGGNYAHRVDVNRRDEIGDLANNINLLGNSLEQNREARQRWIAEISHELRTPLAVLRGEIEAVQDGVRTLDGPALDSLHGEVLSLGRLIDDLHTLSVSDVGALDYQLEKLDVAELLGSFLESHQQALAEHSLTLTHDLGSQPMLISGDAQRLEQLFSNLLQNTCRYTDDGGEVRVALCKERSHHKEVNQQDFVLIDWFDSAPGVAPEALPKLFDPLFRTESSRNREYGGTGLGLSIAKRIVEAHNGKITATSSYLGGLHIQVELPVLTESV